MADRITVVDPDGQVGNIPVEQEKDWLAQGPEYRVLHIPAPTAEDLTENGTRVNVFYKHAPEGTSTVTIPDSEKGSVTVPQSQAFGSVPIEQMNDPEFKNNFILWSEANKRGEYSKLVDAASKQIDLKTRSWDDESDPSDMAGQNNKTNKAYDSADLMQDGKWKMQRELPDGTIAKFLVPQDKLQEYYQQGATFQDQKYQALIDAYDKRIKFNENGDFAAYAIDEALAGIPKLATKNMANDPKTNNMSRASYLALAKREATDPEFIRAQKYGRPAGLAASIGLAPEGVFGEFAAGEKLAQGTRAALGGGALATVAGEAVRGAAIVSPRAAAEVLIDKNPKAALETLALGAGIGVLTHGAIKGTGAVVEKIAESRLTKAMEEVGISEPTIAKMGTPAQQEKFLRLMEEKGLAAKGAAAKTEEVLQKIVQGEEMRVAATKMSQFADKIPASKLTAMVERIGEKVSPQLEGAPRFDAEMGKWVEKQTKEINKFADKEGNLSMSQVMELGSKLTGKGEEGTLKLATQSWGEALTHQGMILGETAIEKADAKVLEQWAQAKYNQQVASEMLKPDFAERVNQALQPEAKAAAEPVKEGIVGKVQELAGSGISKLLNKALHYPTHVIAGAVGHAVGGIPGMLVGGAISAGLEKGAQAIKGLATSYMENPANTSKLKGWLAKQPNNEHLASYVAMDAIKNLESRIAQIKPALTNTTIKVSSVATNDAFKNMLGSSANGLTKKQQMERVNNSIATLAAHPDMARAVVKNASKDLAAHPVLQSDFEQHMLDKMQYLYKIMPKDPLGKQPFTRDRNWQPSEAEAKDWQRQLTLAQDPFYVMDLVKNNTIKEKDVATLAVINPEILSMMRAEVSKMAFDKNVNLPYQNRLSLSILMGENMVKSLNDIPANQNTYQVIDTIQPPPEQTQATQLKQQKPIKPEGLPAQYTTSQRVSGK